MADKDFTAGDPWGLPIEESDDLDIEDSWTEDRRSDSPEEEPIEPAVDDSPAEPEEVPEGEAWTEPALDQDETDFDSSEFDQPAPDDSLAEEPGENGEEFDSGTGTDAQEEEPAAVEDDYAFKAPTRTPLSQMIAAAQSVVSSVQGEEPPTDVQEVEADEPIEPALEAVEDLPEEPAAPPTATTDEDSVSPSVPPIDDDDLPEEPPAWLIVDQPSEPEPPAERPVEHATVYEGDLAFTPEDIEESIAELTTPPVTDIEFAEDHLEMPTEEGAPDEVLDDIDLDSSPGVYGELTDLADQDAQAESLLQEAAAAFGGEDEMIPEVEAVSKDEVVSFEPDEPTELPSSADLDAFAETFAAEFEGDDGAVEPGREEAVDEVEEPLVGVDEIDSLAEALATGLGPDDTDEQQEGDVDYFVDETELDEALAEDTDDQIDSLAEAFATGLGPDDTLEPLTDDVPHRPAEELAEDTGDQIDSLAEALATGLGPDDTDDQPEGDVDYFVDETELDEALAELSVEVEEETVLEPDDVDSDEAGFIIPEPEEIAQPFGFEPAEASPIHAIDEVGAEPTDTASDAEDVADDGTFEPIVPIETDATGAALIESPVTWGARYREAQQGWVDDEEGRSTWRPIVTSGESVAGWELDTYLGLVSGDVSFDPEGSESVSAAIATAREDATRHMLDDALARGAHAVVSVAFSAQEVAGAVHVSASGVAVTLRTPA